MTKEAGKGPHMPALFDRFRAEAVDGGTGGPELAGGTTGR